jgi:hypothetical protein
MKASIKNQIAEAMNSGKFVSGRYLKKNGEETMFHGRAGVYKHTKGGVNCNNPENFLIWDIKRERYMALIPERVLSLVASNNLYETI